MDSTPQTWARGGDPLAMNIEAGDDFANLIDFDLDNLADFSYTHAQNSLHFNLYTQFSPPNSQDQGTSLQQAAHGFSDYSTAPISQTSTPLFPQPQAQLQEHLYRPRPRVPPTPNSVEMHAEPHRYLQQVDPQQALFDHHYHTSKDDVSFTPLVSPAVTPHDARFQIPDFNMPGAYFTPLTSPALTAQGNQNAPHYMQQTPSGSSTGHSPIDVDMDMLGEPAMVSQEPSRKPRSINKRAPPRTTNPSARVRQSPIVKPNRRKATMSSLIPKEVSELLHDARVIQSASGSGRDTSETDSISPEPMLSEMRPPPKPASLTASPAMMAMQSGPGTTPATPASLMQIHPSPNLSIFLGTSPTLDDLTLPEPSLDRPVLSKIEPAIPDMDAGTTTLHNSARKMPKLKPLSTAGQASISSRPSPLLGATSSPTSPAFSTANGKKDSKIVRNPKKRNSVSTSLVSPALRPKISPSIKPLLPECASGSKATTTDDDTHALLLASKSNYQNLLDGTTVPGVVYPTSLSTHLTSKRTSHKIAEQGRRNRINMALLEMQALLPSPVLGPTPTDAKTTDSAAQQQSNSSKAAKVESAIDYIKTLKHQVSQRDKLLSEKDEEMNQLRKELAALRERSSSSGACSGQRLQSQSQEQDREQVLEQEQEIHPEPTGPETNPALESHSSPITTTHPNNDT